MRRERWQLTVAIVDYDEIVLYSNGGEIIEQINTQKKKTQNIIHI